MKSVRILLGRQIDPMGRGRREVNRIPGAGEKKFGARGLHALRTRGFDGLHLLMKFALYICMQSSYQSFITSTHKVFAYPS